MKIFWEKSDASNLVQRNQELSELLCQAIIELEAVEDMEGYCRRAEAAEIIVQAKKVLGIEDCHRA